jgi:pimeloyl-ACP methyl ester carboxylesterase
MQDHEEADTIAELGAPSKIFNQTIHHPLPLRCDLHEIRGEHLGIPNDQLPKFTDPGYFQKLMDTKAFDVRDWTEAFDEKVEVDGLVTYVKHCASDSKNPVFLCLHGAGQTALSFAAMTLSLKDHGHVVAFDMRGHGETQKGKD